MHRFLEDLGKTRILPQILPKSPYAYKPLDTLASRNAHPRSRGTDATRSFIASPPDGEGNVSDIPRHRGRANSETAKASPRTLDVFNPGRSQTPGTLAALALVLAGASPPTTETHGRLARNKLNISLCFV